MANDPRILFSERIKGDGPGPLSEIIPAGKLNAESALAVYARGYLVRLTDALGETYEAVWWCLGDKLFKEFAESYIKKFPSSVYNLSHYGNSFVDFLRNENVTQEFPFLPDLAQFEWNFYQLFHAPETVSSVTAKELAGLTSDFVFKLVGHAQMFRFDYGILNIWNAYKSDLPVTTEAWQKPQNFLLFKQDGDLKIRELSLAEYFLLHFSLQSKALSHCVKEVNDLGLNLASEEVQGLFAFLWEHKLIKELAPKCDA